MMRRKKAETMLVGNEWWDRDEWERVRDLAIEVSGADVQLIDKLVRHVQDAHRRGRPDTYHGGMFSSHARWQKLVRDLYQRAGAAAASQDSPQGIPLTVAEVKEVKQVRDDIYFYSGYYMRDRRDPCVDEADDLLNRLHFLIGHARAAGSAGGVTVFREPGRAQLPAAE
jgi:hypothetical protein